jgi:hypothetical protein
MKHFIYFSVAVSLLLTGCATSVMTSGRVVIQDDESTLAIAFSSRDRRLIRDYYNNYKPKKAPPGLAKRRHLPPGLAKRDTLPSGLRGRNLPGELERRLSQLPDGYIRVIVGSDIVLVKTHTRVIIDIYRNIYSD